MGGGDDDAERGDMTKGVKPSPSGARPRVLLRRIRETLARAGDREERLNRIVELIATNMVAEVCSIYLLDTDKKLELLATEGLNRDAMRRARLAIGEGLVGRIAKTGETINTDDAANTPGFRLVPGIGEEIYRSFLGAPIRRQGHMLGVLVVQNQAPRIYDEEEVDALELIATVIAEIVEAGALLPDRTRAAQKSREPQMLLGVSAADGVAMGVVVLHEPKIVVANPFAEDGDKERQRLRDAMETIRAEIDSLVAGENHLGEDSGFAADLRRPGEHRDVLAAFRMVAHDKGWLRRLEAAVEGGLSAEAAVEKVQNETRSRLERTADPYLRERLSDLDDLANRLLRALLGIAPPAPEHLPQDAILVARTMGPGELLEYGRGGLVGLAFEEGSAGSHAAIVARALNIPLVTNVRNLVEAAEPDQPVIIDGDVGRVLLQPDATVVAAYRETLAHRAQEKEQFRAISDKPAETQDGVRIALHMNAGLLTDLPSLKDSGAEGVGLFRTELQYLIMNRAPRRDAQAALYRQVLEAVGDKPAIFRTLDMGGDKQLPFLKGEAEENPALGWRAIRIALDRPLLFRMQLQALVRASGGRPLNVMFPMVAEADEYDRARDLLEEVIHQTVARGYASPSSVRIGAMLETPALAYASDAFFRKVDFVSVGGNDLAQFFFAADRGNERVRRRYDLLSCAFLRFLRIIARRAEEGHTALSFCGEAAARPLEALALSAIGFRTLSLRPASIGPVKRAIRSARFVDVRAVVDEALESDGHSVRQPLTTFCKGAGIPL